MKTVIHKLVDSPSVVFGGGILFISIGGCVCYLFNLPYPMEAQLVVAVVGISVGLKVAP